MSDLKVDLNETQKKIFAAIDKNDAVLLQAALTENPNVNIVDENAMTPLQHAAYKGKKDLVQILLDCGANPNLCKHQHNYTALHFAGLSGSLEVCLALLMAGAKTGVQNGVNRTAAQMAAFVGHHNCVSIINNYIPKEDVDCYTVAKGEQAPLLPPFLTESFHKFVMQINIHPVKVVLNLNNFVGLGEHLAEVKKVLELMAEREMKRGAENNEVLSFKFHYLSYIVGHMVKICDKQTLTPEFVEKFAKKVLKPTRDGSLEFFDGWLKESVKEFPFKDCTLFRQMVASLASQDPPSAISVINSAINGQRGFIDNIALCSTCGEENPEKKCSKCKVSQYCDHICQKLHWPWHKKFCSLLAEEAAKADLEKTKVTPDVAELSSEVQNLLVQN